MAFSRKKPAPKGRAGRLRKETTVTEVTETTSEPVVIEAEPEAEVVQTRVTTTTRGARTGGGGLETALVVVTLVALIAAFLMLQVEMRSAFGEGWPV